MYIPPLVKNNLQLGIRGTKYENIIVGNKEGLLNFKDAIDKSLNLNNIVPFKIPTSYMGEYKGIVCLNDNDIEQLVKDVNLKEGINREQTIIEQIKSFIFIGLISFLIGVGIYTVFNWIF